MRFPMLSAARQLKVHLRKLLHRSNLIDQKGGGSCMSLSLWALE